MKEERRVLEKGGRNGKIKRRRETLKYVALADEGKGKGSERRRGREREKKREHGEEKEEEEEKES